MGTGLLTFNYLTAVGRHQSAVVAPRRIVVAARDIPARVQITADMVTTVMRPGDAIDPDAMNDMANAVGRTAAVSIPAGGTVSTSKILAAVNPTLDTRVPRGMRAVSIPIDRVKGVGNLIQPGDHVDVIAVVPARGTMQPRVATILRDVPVLAIGLALETPQGATPAPDTGYQTATLAVAPAQAKLLALVDLNATLRLALRAPGDEKMRKPMTGEPIDLSMPAPPQARMAAAPAAAQAPAAPATPKAVAAAKTVYNGPQVIDGDKVIR
jgi:pilus assembly protein CpaB